MGLGFSELIIVGIVVMVLLGPQQLPQVLQTLGKLMREITKARREFMRGIDQDDDLKNIRESIHEVKQNVEGDIGSFKASFENHLKKLADEPTQPDAPAKLGTPSGSDDSGGKRDG